MVVVTFLRLLMFAIFIFAIFYVARMVFTAFRGSKRQPTSNVDANDRCPVCQEWLNIPNNEAFCPGCGSHLVRGPSGKFRVKAN